MPVMAEEFVMVSFEFPSIQLLKNVVKFMCNVGLDICWIPDFSFRAKTENSSIGVRKNVVICDSERWQRSFQTFLKEKP